SSRRPPASTPGATRPCAPRVPAGPRHDHEPVAGPWRHQSLMPPDGHPRGGPPPDPAASHARERPFMTATPRTAPPDGPLPARRRPALLELLTDISRLPEGQTALVGAGVGVALVGLIFWTNLRHFVISWSSDENYSHGFLVPLISLYFANLAAERGPVKVRGGVAVGATLLTLAVLA